jgi:DNA-directed RNA polymerase specialized sigma54-like protein
MGKSTISMAIFNSYVKLPEGTHIFKKFFVVGIAE